MGQDQVSGEVSILCLYYYFDIIVQQDVNALVWPEWDQNASSSPERKKGFVQRVPRDQ